MINLNQDVSYNDNLKKSFEKNSCRFLKLLSRELRLLTYSIHYNKGGVAVSGDATLIGMFTPDVGVYVTISTPSHYGIMFRSVKHMQDWTGGNNNWFQPDKFSTYQEIANHIRRTLNVVSNPTRNSEAEEQHPSC
jgi:hypothetical protein